MKKKILELIDSEQKKGDIADFKIGDTVNVHTRIKEGEKERIQLYTGTVIARDGSGSTRTFTVRRLTHGEGVERVFPLFSPNIAKLDVERAGRTRRAKLYYLRKLSGKKFKVKESSREETAETAAAAT